jgi:LPXTG-site transpeptidase (sortase) family protein
MGNTVHTNSQRKNLRVSKRQAESLKAQFVGWVLFGILMLALLSNQGFKLFAQKQLLRFDGKSTKSSKVVAQNNISQKSTTTKQEATNIISGRPSFIELPRLDIKLEVVTGGFDTKTREWQFFDDKVMHMLGTDGLSSTTGNTVVYGHDRWEYFAKTKNIEKGDEMIVTSDTGQKATYIFEGEEVVNPEGVDSIKSGGSPRVTLLTCSGSASEFRRLLVFKFVSGIKENI